MKKTPSSSPRACVFRAQRKIASEIFSRTPLFWFPSWHISPSGRSHSQSRSLRVASETSVSRAPIHMRSRPITAADPADVGSGTQTNRHAEYMQNQETAARRRLHNDTPNSTIQKQRKMERRQRQQPKNAFCQRNVGKGGYG